MSMVSTVELFRIVATEHIFLRYADLKGYWLGVYFWDPDLAQGCIVLETTLRSRERLLRCVLAHELGHHFSSAGQHIVAASMTGVMRVTRAERLANNWAVDKLVPADEFLRLVNDRRTFEEVVDYFYVTPEFVINRARRIYRNLPARDFDSIWVTRYLE